MSCLSVMAAFLRELTVNPPEQFRPVIPDATTNGLTTINGRHAGLPKNFGEVVKGMYRSSHPKVEHTPELQRLGIKYVLTLWDSGYEEDLWTFFRANGIRVFQVLVTPHKNFFYKTPEEAIIAALGFFKTIFPAPVLIHCRQGKHRTGCLVALFRIAQGYSDDEAIDEYRHYAREKSRPRDTDYIANFNKDSLRQLGLDSPPYNWVRGELRLVENRAVNGSGRQQQQ